MTARLTDREAIRKITRAMIGHLTGSNHDESVVIEQLQYLLADLAEPAAPDYGPYEDGGKFIGDEPAAPTDDDQPCEHGGCEICAYNRGHADGLAAARKLNVAPTIPDVGPRDCPDDGTAMIRQRSDGWDCPRCHKHFPAAPTVTREQAEELIFRAMASITTDQSGLWAGFRADGVSWPAFFRAVADALDKEA